MARTLRSQAWTVILSATRLTIRAGRTWSCTALLRQAMAEISDGRPVADDVLARGNWNAQVCAVLTFLL